MCAGGNGLAMYKFDYALPADAPGGIEQPTLLWSKAMTGVTTGHSGSFTYDGKYLLYGHEPGGGSAARCQATSTIVERTLYMLDPLTGDVKGEMLHPRPQNSRENCTWHNFNVIPTKAGYYATVGSYQSGISVFEFTNPAAPREIAYADPAPLQNPANEPPATGIILGGDWSTYWHNGVIYESDIKRGVTTWRLNLAADTTAAQANEHLKHINTFATSNPQTQVGSYAAESEAPTITVASPLEGGKFKLGSTAVADFTCADNVAIESCTGTVAKGETMTMSSLGNKTFRVTAIDTAGNITTKDVAYMVNSTDVIMGAGAGTVDTTLALTLPATAPSFGAFTPGVAREYLDHRRAAGHHHGRRHDADGPRPRHHRHGSPRQRHVDADQPGPALRVEHEHARGGGGGRQRRRGRGSDAAAQLLGPGHQRGDHADVPPEHHRDGGPAQRELRQGADVHAVNDDAVSVSGATWGMAF